MGQTGSFFSELRRRKVFRVGAAYAGVGWLLIEIADLLLDNFGAPDWVVNAFTILVFLGFPLALICAWAFDLTPEGLQRTNKVAPPQFTTRTSGRTLDFAIIGVLAIAVVIFMLDKFVWVAEQSPATVEMLVERNSIAVLPFSDMSSAEENAAFLAAGIHDDLLTMLSKIRAIKVISRTSVERYRNTNKSMREIGRELGVVTILEGGVQRAGDQIRVNAQLIDVATDGHLWAETYDRQLTAINIFAIQSEIATAIAEAMRTTLSQKEKERLASVPTRSLEAYEAYLRGKQRMETLTVEAIREATAYFENATILDPGFALAWVGLADSYNAQVGHSNQDREDILLKSGAAIDQAIRLDNRLGEAHSSMGDLLYIKGDYSGAEKAFQRALELNPNYASAHHGYGYLLHEFGRLEQALTEYESAARLDPFSPVILDEYAFALSEIGRFDEALARFQKVIEIDPAYPYAAISIGTIYGLVYGRLDLAYHWYRKAQSLDPANPFISAVLGLVFLELNDDDRAEYWITRALGQGSNHSWANGAMVMLQSYRADAALVRQYTEEVMRLDPRWRFGTALAHDRVENLRDGEYDEIRDRYYQAYPELLAGDEPEVNSANYRPAIDIAAVLAKSGDQERADELLARCLAQIGHAIRVGYYGYWISDVQIHALQGNTRGALAALRQAIDQGWRTDWRYFFLLDPNLDSIRHDPEFVVMREEIEADMAAQLGRVRAMEASGELPVIPEPAGH